MAKVVQFLALFAAVEYVNAFGSVPDGEGNAVELQRSPCQDIFFGKGTKRINPLKPGQRATTTVCGQIESGRRNKNVRFARQNKGTAEWCNQGDRKGNPDNCAQAYALVGQQYTLCEYNVNTGDCLLSSTQQERSCRAPPDVCRILRSATNAGGPNIVSIPNSQSFEFLCSQLTTKTTCNNRIFAINGTPNPTLEQFASCAWDGTSCSGLGPHVCPVVARRELENEEALESDDLEQDHARQLQASNPCATFSTQAACDNGYIYAPGVSYDYASYSNTNRPPDLAICEWRQGSCQQLRTCPYMCELAADRNVDVPGTVDTDATLTFGDRALETFCETDIDRTQRASVCENYYRVEKTNSGVAPRQVTACRHGEANSGPFCTREIRPGFRACI